MGNNIISKIQSHRRLLRLAIPLILANVTTPLLGLIDTAILGRIDNVSVLAGAAIASLIITQIYWVCGFMKMSITGLSAQSLSRMTSEDDAESVIGLKMLAQGCFMALFLACILLLLQVVLVKLGLFLSEASLVVAANVKDYFYTRIWGAPAALINMVLIGWLIGQQKTKWVLYLQVVINLSNIAASLLFVFALNWGVKGVAGATVFAEYLMMLLALYYVYIYLTKQPIKQLKASSGQSEASSGQTESKLKAVSGQSESKLVTKIVLHRSWFRISEMSELLKLNGYIFVRNLALQLTLAFVTLKGAQYGAQAAAVNAILLQFFSLIALGLDGIANAVEALVGHAKGIKSKKSLRIQVKIGLMWSSLFAVVYSLLFYFLDSLIVNLLTHHKGVIAAMIDYKWIIVLLPIIAHWCFLFDGVFVGLSKGKPMRNTMIISALLGFLPVWFIFSEMGNLALWLAMLSFLSYRGLLLGGYYFYIMKQKGTAVFN